MEEINALAIELAKLTLNYYRWKELGQGVESKLLQNEIDIAYYKACDAQNAMAQACQARARLG